MWAVRLQFVRPVGPTIVPCKRPVRLPVKRLFAQAVHQCIAVILFVSVYCPPTIHSAYRAGTNWWYFKHIRQRTVTAVVWRRAIKRFARRRSSWIGRTVTQGTLSPLANNIILLSSMRVNTVWCTATKFVAITHLGGEEVSVRLIALPTVHP